MKARPTSASRLDRMFALRAILLGATLLGMLSCLPLWLNSRDYPLLPLVPVFSALGYPWDRVMIAAALGSLLLAFKFYRPCVLFFLGAVAFLYLGDQNRGQPWLYLYCIMLAPALLPVAIAFAACRLVFSAVYVWAGIHKLNANYFKILPEWFVSPAADWGLPDAVVELLRVGVAVAPIVEILIGFLLWPRGARRLALGAIVLIHAAALLFLGPLGHGYNFVVLPWNLAMIALAFVLFPPSEKIRWPDTIQSLRRSTAATAGVLLVCLLPILNFFGWWDSYFSFVLYSMSQASADIYVTEEFRDKLPPRLAKFVRDVRPSYNPEYQKPLLFDYISWSMSELGSPGLIEPRGYRSVFRYLNDFTDNSNDLHMILVPRRGPILICRGETVTPANFD